MIVFALFCLSKSIHILSAHFILYFMISSCISVFSKTLLKDLKRDNNIQKQKQCSSIEPGAAPVLRVACSYPTPASSAAWAFPRPLPSLLIPTNITKELLLEQNLQLPLSSELMGLSKEDSDKWKQDHRLLLFLGNLVMRRKLSTILLCTRISEYTHDNRLSWKSFFFSPNRNHQNHSKQLLGQGQAALCTNYFFFCLF